ncbi:MAG TPA: hypothetical protein HPP66_09250 [Planctomycetes bacterium]|nr:hypothetical protein [Planctomycetota bacterium]
MKQLLVLAGFAVVLSGVVGCQSANRRIEKVIDGEGQFPEFLAGVWEAEINDSKWAFKFEDDGSISKITHVLAGEVDLEEGGTYLKGREPGTSAIFLMGPCEAEYNANTCELRVKIILDYYKMKLPQGELEGKSHDFFKGPVYEDDKTWKTEWLSYSWLEGADPPDTDAIESNPVSLIFKKLKIK